MKRVLITGGAGFIGSNLTKKLLKTTISEIFIFDNLSSGFLSNIPIHDKRIKFYNIDLKTSYLDWPLIKELDYIFHFAANADVRGGVLDREIDLIQNVLVTKSICDYAKLSKSSHLVFSSSATVYGEPNSFPTKEIETFPQTSVYGASKMAGEAYIQAYSEYGDFKSTIFRFVSWIGPGYSHGVIFDFYKKLVNCDKNLEILGNGLQKKSFLDVDDGVEAILQLSKHGEKSQIFNLGHEEIMSVKVLADIVCSFLNLKNVKYLYSGSNRGWIGDSPMVHLDISKAKGKGWAPTISIKEGIHRTLNYLINKDNLLRTFN